MPSSDSSQPARASRLAVLITAGAVLLVPLALGAIYLAERPAATVAASAPAAGGGSGTPMVEGAPEAARSDAPPSPAGTVVAGAAQGPVKGFQPPPEQSIPDNEYGETIRLGELIFTQTGKYAAKYVGNDLNCVNCHLDAGRKANSAPLWSAFAMYPAFRSKTGRVDTFASRLQGCFDYSMNGKAPPADDDVIVALETYAFFLAKGAPVGTAMEGGGYPKLKRPAQPPDYARGEKVYAQHCALCHGADGQGQRAGDRQVFPPLWGPRSFNWGAGMHQINNAAGFIYANMPLGKPRSLTEQEAWDVALFMNGHERPQDPRFTGSVEETRKKFHDSPDSPYGMTINGHLLGSAPAGKKK
jgi:thiosulfate dehydrogenase